MDGGGSLGNDCAEPLFACPLREREGTDGPLSLSHTRINGRSYSRVPLAPSPVSPVLGKGHLGGSPGRRLDPALALARSRK